MDNFSYFLVYSSIILSLQSISRLEMSDYVKILKEFTKLGLTQTMIIKQDQINRTMDRICSANSNVGQFDRAVAEQLWEHTEKTDNGTAILRSYIQTIADAQKILKENIAKCEKQLRFQNDREQQQELQQCMESYHQDYRLLSLPFGLQQLSSSQVLSNQHSRNGQPSRIAHNASTIFADAPSARQESASLKLVFMVTICLFSMQLIVMAVKHHFLNILVYCSILSIFFLNYFDRAYMRYCLVATSLSVVLDVLWLIIHTKDYWNPYAPNMYSELSSPFLKFAYLLALTMLFFRVLIVVLLFRFRSNDQKSKKSVKFFSLKFNLDGETARSPFSIFQG